MTKRLGVPLIQRMLPYLILKRRQGDLLLAIEAARARYSAEEPSIRCRQKKAPRGGNRDGRGILAVARSEIAQAREATARDASETDLGVTQQCTLSAGMARRRAKAFPTKIESAKNRTYRVMEKSGRRLAALFGFCREASVQLEDALARHLVDEEIGQRPNERIDAVG